MAKRKIRILNSPTLAIGIAFGALLCWGCFIIFITSLPSAFETHTFLAIFYTVMFVIMPIVMLMVCARRMFSIITIDETGISRSFLGIFFKLHIPWDGIAEVYCFTALAIFIKFSKDRKLSTMKYDKMRGYKNAIEFTLSRRRYAVVAQYLQQPIVNMPEAVKDYFSGKIKKLKL